MDRAHAQMAKYIKLAIIMIIVQAELVLGVLLLETAHIMMAHGAVEKSYVVHLQQQPRGRRRFDAVDTQADRTMFISLHHTYIYSHKSPTTRRVVRDCIRMDI